MPLPDKYRPEKFDDIILPDDIKNQIKSWMDSWMRHEETKKALILYGTQGVGKTTLAGVISRCYNLPLIEMNGSDQRNRENMKKVALMAAEYRDLFNYEQNYPDRIILIDEADNIFESRDPAKGGDSGGISELLEIIKNTLNPVILTMNDFYEFKRKSSAREIISLSISMEITPYKKRSERNYHIYIQKLLERLKYIASNENIKINDSQLMEIIKKDEPDMRATLNDLELYRGGNNAEDAYRDEQESIYYVVSKTFKSGNYNDIINSLYAINGDTDFPGFYMQWLAENAGMEYKNPEDLKNIFYILSQADIYYNMRIRDYSLSSYSMEIAGGISFEANERNEHYVKYNFPAFIKNMSSRKGNTERYNIQTVLEKLALVNHMPSNEMAKYLWFYKFIKKHDRKLFSDIIKILEITDKEKNALE